MIEAVVEILKQIVTTFAWFVYGVTGLFTDFIFRGGLMNFPFLLLVGTGVCVVVVIVISALFIRSRMREE